MLFYSTLFFINRKCIDASKESVSVILVNWFNNYSGNIRFVTQSVMV